MLKCVDPSWCDYKNICELDEDNQGIKRRNNGSSVFMCKTLNSVDQIFSNL